MTATKKAAAKKGPQRPRTPRVSPPTPAETPDAYSDELLAELDAQLTDAPKVRQLHHLDRRTRARATRLLSEIAPRVNALQKLYADLAAASEDTETPDTEAPDIADTDYADVMELLADAEDVLAVFAVDEDQFRAWAHGATDQQLITLLSRVSGGVGEASSSSS